MKRIRGFPIPKQRETRKDETKRADEDSERLIIMVGIILNTYANGGTWSGVEAVRKFEELRRKPSFVLLL